MGIAKRLRETPNRPWEGQGALVMEEAGNNCGNGLTPADGKPTAGDDRPGVPEGQWRTKVPLSRRGHQLEPQRACQKPTPRATGARPPGWEGHAASPEGTSEAGGRTGMRAPWGKCGIESAALTATQAAIRARGPGGCGSGAGLAAQEPGRLLLSARAAQSKRPRTPLPCHSRVPPAASSASVGR